jgi:hypothetical protein
MARLDPKDIRVGPGEQVFHALAHFTGSERSFECEVAARDEDQARLRVRTMLLMDSSVRAIVQVYGDPTTIEVFALDEWVRRGLH